MEVKPLQQGSVPAGYKQTEVGVIPEDWSVVSAFDACSKIQDGTHFSPRSGGRDYLYVTSKNIRFGHLDVSTASWIDAAQHQAIYRRCDVKKGDLLLTKDGANTGNAALNTLDEEFSLLSSVALLRFNPSKHCAAYFLQQVLTSQGQRQIQDAMAGNAITRLTLEKINKLRFPSPPTKAEQEAIAEALSDADALIESLEQLLAKKRQLKQGAMQELLTGKKRLPGFESKRGHKQTEVGVIPEDWEVRPLLTAVRIAQGQVDPKIEPYKSMFLVGPAHVESGSGKLKTRQTAAEQGAISGKYLFAEGDIIYGKINPYLRKAFLADFSGLCSADMYPLKPLKDVSPGFMLPVILGRRFTKYAESVSVRSGMPKINRTEMAEFIFPIPSDKAEQTAIAAILSDMDAEIAALEAKLAKARQIKQGMMQELLTGRIRLV